MQRMKNVSFMKGGVAVGLFVSLTACNASLPIVGDVGPGRLMEMKAESDREKQRQKEEEERKVAEAERQKEQAIEDEKRKVAAAEREAELEAKKKKAEKSEQVVLSELGLAITVPGDVAYEPHHTNKYGDPALFLSGEASGFALIVTDAKNDRYGLTERMRSQMGEFTYGIDIIRTDENKEGGWILEYSYPEYFNDGTRAGTGYGIFSRQMVGGRKVNCLIAGESEQEIGRAIEACESLKPAG
jgi:hypothetical protein